MAEYDDDLDDDYFFDDDYLYVEDSYALADELAENSLPPAQIIDVIEDEWLENYDHYDYWMDIEYGTDEYYDIRAQVIQDEEEPTTGQKRKAPSAKTGSDSVKRRKVAGGKQKQVQQASTRIWRGDNVVWKPAGDVFTLEDPRRQFTDSKPYSLLPGWRGLVKDIKPKGEDAPMEQKAATSAPPKPRKKKTAPRRNPQAAEESSTPTNQAAGAVDMDQIMQILQARLSEAGLGDDEVGNLQELLGELVANGGGELGDMLEQLTSSVLEKVEAGGADSGLGRWLTGQGVDLEGVNDDDVEEDAQEEDPNDPDSRQEDVMDATAPVNAPPHTAASTNGTSDDCKADKTKAPPPTPVNGKTAKAGSRSKEQDNAVKSKKGPVTKSTRGTKRKASEEVDAVEPQPTKHSRGFAASTKSSQQKAVPEKRSTRSRTKKS